MFQFYTKDYTIMFQFYTKDTFGLRTLKEQGRMKLCTVAGVEHLFWPSSKDVFKKCILPYLSV